ncbi:iron uptake transporter permease EfeU [Schumannella sp. 10F1B-5-1]|uniref:iron uptake transporter permease EfeU n=1 Tax=Schumannella sp. 10F1B-5-1 TaxID=2590780 RepID=UPI0011315DB5|nr:iron uptake transporter permease EfeU [Schumannella sp. 10F1B-5-1]TPW73126.1 high-affinity Fe2+/Pb2+ permease [Schumannella sp. 10F1B-5-1]
MLANYLIGLREGLEAGLIVGILVAYLRKSGRRDLLPKLWIGITAAIALSLGVGAILTWGPSTLSFQAQEIIGGGLSIVAVGFVTWMVLWMAKHAPTLSRELRERADAAILGGSAVGLVVLGVVSVGREGIETAIFVWASVSATGTPTIGFLGAILGILTAVALSAAISLGFLRIDLGRFFRWTGIVLVVVAAGVFAYGVGDLQEAGVLPGIGQHAFSLAAIVPPTSWWGILLAGLFNLTAEPTWLQVIVWVAYVAIVLPLFLLRQRPARPRSDVAAPGSTGTAANPTVAGSA